ncbi:hypothetical protein BGZ68_009638 [Mortierella alpina]|nr:hypothetical protein BGZ68_009638 [Mortierella alpina]
MSGHRPRKTTAATRKRNAASRSGSTAAIPTAILAGTFAALASVFAKLTLDARTVDFLHNACNTFLAPTTPYCTSLFIAKEGETSPAVLGYLLFSEPLALQWWFGASLIVVGSVLVSSDETSASSKTKSD